MRKIVLSGLGILALFCIGLVFTSCKKYADGPLISIRSAENRITGNFILNKFYIDGSTENQLWADSICSTRVNFEPSTGKFDVAHTLGLLSGSFKLIDSKKTLSLYDIKETDEYPGYGPFKALAVSTWTILKLTNNETWIETEYENKHYQVELTRQ
ncbi:MAG: hypothetical protein WCM76_01870 [Bacteroidota bacterium]